MTAPHLLLAYDFPPIGGGIARWMHELALRYPERSLVVSTGMHEGAAEVDATIPVPVDRVPIHPRRLRTVDGLVRWSARADRLARSHGVAFSWCGNLRPAAYPARWLLARRGIPYGVILHGGDVLRLEAMMTRSLRRRIVGRLLLSGAGLVVTNSGYTREAALRLLAGTGVSTAPDRVIVVPLGTDPTRFNIRVDPTPARERFGLGAGRWMVTVARLVPHKGIDTSLRVLAQLAPRYPDLGYAIAGTGPDLGRLQSLAATLGVTDRVRWLGNVPDPLIASLHRASSVYLGLSRRDGVEVEGFGIAMVEASGCGLPVIGGRSGGVPDAVREGETGLLVDPVSVEEATAAVALLLDDPMLARRLGQGGREAVESFYNWDRVARDMRRLGDEVTAALRVPAR